MAPPDARALLQGAAAALCAAILRRNAVPYDASDDPVEVLLDAMRAGTPRIKMNAEERRQLIEFRRATIAGGDDVWLSRALNEQARAEEAEAAAAKASSEEARVMKVAPLMTRADRAAAEADDESQTQLMAAAALGGVLAVTGLGVAASS